MHCTTEAITTDEALELLANYDRREMLRYLAETDGGSATVDEIVAVLSSDGTRRGKRARDEGHVRTELHHRHLPRLVAENVVEYDERTETVRYRANQKLDELLTFVSKNFA